VFNFLTIIIPLGKIKILVANTIFIWKVIVKKNIYKVIVRNWNFSDSMRAPCARVLKFSNVWLDAKRAEDDFVCANYNLNFKRQSYHHKNVGDYIYVVNQMKVSVCMTSTSMVRVSRVRVSKVRVSRVRFRVGFAWLVRVCLVRVGLVRVGVV